MFQIYIFDEQNLDLGEEENGTVMYCMLERGGRLFLERKTN